MALTSGRTPTFSIGRRQATAGHARLTSIVHIHSKDRPKSAAVGSSSIPKGKTQVELRSCSSACPDIDIRAMDANQRVDSFHSAQNQDQPLRAAHARARRAMCLAEIRGITYRRSVATLHHRLGPALHYADDAAPLLPRADPQRRRIFEFREPERRRPGEWSGRASLRRHHGDHLST